jgi:D-sedoheptulose 7-phosphate isomerase
MSRIDTFSLSMYLEWLNKSFKKVTDEQVDSLTAQILAAKRVFICGNGGSASTATHMACDLAKTTGKDIHAISLCDNAAMITAVGNDANYRYIFQAQLQFQKLDTNDLLIVISASGNSSNVLQAADYARVVGATVYGLLGFQGGAMKKLADHTIIIDSMEFGIIEDAHAILMHLVTDKIKRL